MSLTTTTTTMALVFVLLSTAIITILAPVPTEAFSKAVSASPPVDCSSVVLSMADCLSYVTNGSTTEKPEGGCCSGLKEVLKTNPACLCQAFQQSAQFGVVLNVTKALALPSACRVHAPSATKCGMSLSAAPAGAPVGGVVAPAGAPSITTAPLAGNGSTEIAPAVSPSKAGSSSSVTVSVPFIIAGIAAAFFT